MAGTLRDRAQAVQTVKCAGTEVGRQNSGAVKPEDKPGPRFRAPYSGYSLSSIQADSVQKSTFILRGLAGA
jgi:hypothetical protein